MKDEILYDFQAALTEIIRAHGDMKLVTSKWQEMLDSTPRDVEFVFADGDKATIPNIAKVIDTINERTLPPNPKFDTVRASSSNGTGELAPARLLFAGSGKRMTYNVNGIEGIPVPINDGDTMTLWPLPRYMHIAEGENPSIVIAPSLPDTGVVHMSDFFVQIPDGASVTFSFHSPGYSQRMQLSASGFSVWHVWVQARDAARIGVYTTARAIKFDQT